jgi:hypothetical protein
MNSSKLYESFEECFNIRNNFLSKITWSMGDNSNKKNNYLLKIDQLSSGHIWSYIFIYNMKPARPWMLAHLKIIWQFHAHPVHQKVSRFFGPRYIGGDLFLGPNLVSFNRAVVPLLELSFLTKSQKLSST